MCIGFLNNLVNTVLKLNIFHFSGCAGRYLFLNIFFPVLNILAQITFQVVLLLNPPYGQLVEPFCEYLDVLSYYELLWD